MKPSCIFIPALFLAVILPGCVENPLYYQDGYDYEPAPPDENPPPLGPPNIAGSVMMTSGAFVTNRGGIMTVSVRASNAGGAERAYDVQGQIIVADGPADIGSAGIILGNLDAGQWVEEFVSIPVTAYPSSATRMILELSWCGWDVNVYQRRVNVSALLKPS